MMLHSLTLPRLRLSIFRTFLISALLVFSLEYKVHATEIQGVPERGREKTQMCAGCHSIEGWRTAFPRTYSVPRLGGQHFAYLKKALEDYKSGDRSHPTMRAIAAGLSEHDIADLAAYYSHQHP